MKRIQMGMSIWPKGETSAIQHAKMRSQWLGLPRPSSRTDPPGRGLGGPPAGSPTTPIPGAPKRPRPPPQAPQSPRGFSHRTKMFTWQLCQTRLRENYAEILALGEWPHSPSSQKS